MSALGFISDIFKPASDIVDALHTSDEEKDELRNKLAEIELSAKEKMMEAASKVAISENMSDSKFTKSYRPAIVTGMFLMIVANCFGLLENPLPDVFIQSFGAVFGIVGGGRSIEKIFKIVKGK